MSAPHDAPGAPSRNGVAERAPVPAATDVDRPVGDRGRAAPWSPWIVGGAVLGLALGAALLVYAPKRFAGGATVLLRSASDGGGSLLSRLGVPAELAPRSLGSAIKSPMETELQLLGSRAVLGRVSDSLGLQVRMLSPGDVPPWRLLAPRAYPGSFRKVRLRFVRESSGAYHVVGRDVDARIAPGRPLATPYGALALATGTLPSQFEVQLLDREDALTRLDERVDVEKSGGEVARVGYAAPTRCRPPRCPTPMVAAYLERRRTTDRSVNQHRAEFLERRSTASGGSSRRRGRAAHASRSRAVSSIPSWWAGSSSSPRQACAEQLARASRSRARRARPAAAPGAAAGA